MPGDEDDAVAREFAGERHRLIGVAEVVTNDQLDALAEHATLGVEILDRELGGALILLAEPGQSAGHIAGRRRSGCRPAPPAPRAPQPQSR